MRTKVIASLGIAIVGLTGALLVLGDDADTVLTGATAGTTVIDEPRTTTTITDRPLGFVEPPVENTTTTTIVCRNSTNPACGPFRWEPAPFPNQALVVRVTREPVDVAVGQAVTFEVESTDTDAQVVWCQVYDLGDGTTMGTVGSFCGNGPGCTGRRFGPWSPPSTKAGAYGYKVTHTYAEPGTYTARFFAYSEDGGECHPYGNQETATATVSVSSRPLVP